MRTPASTVNVGDKVTLAVSLEGTPPFKFQWEKNGQPLEGKTGSSLVIDEARRSDDGIYACVVSNSAGQATGRYRLIVVTR